MKKLLYFLSFLFLSISVFGNTNLIFIPYSGYESLYNKSSLIAVKTKDEIETYTDELDLQATGYTRGGIFLYNKNDLNITLYNLNTYHRLFGVDTQFPVDIYPVATGNIIQSVTQLGVTGDFTELNKDLSLSYYITGTNTTGNRNLYHYRTSPNKANADAFDFEKKEDKQDLYFPHYRVKYSQVDLAPRIGLNRQFEKVKVGFYIGILNTVTKGNLLGSAFAIDRDKKPDFSLDNLDSYIEYNYSYNEDYESIRNIPLGATTNETYGEGILRFELSLLKLIFPRNPFFETSSIEFFYSPNDFTYSQRTNLLFHPNLGLSLGLIYLQSGKKDVDLTIQKNYEIGPLFRYSF